MPRCLLFNFSAVHSSSCCIDVMWCDVCSTWHVTLARNLVILLRWVDVSHCLVSLCCLRSSLFLSHGSRSLSLVSVALCSSRVVLGLSHLCLSGWSSCRLSLGLCRLFVVLSLFFLSCGYETLLCLHTWLAVLPVHCLTVSLVSSWFSVHSTYCEAPCTTDIGFCLSVCQCL